MRSLRLVKIVLVALKYGLDEFLLGHERFHWLRPTARDDFVCAARFVVASTQRTIVWCGNPAVCHA